MDDDEASRGEDLVESARQHNSNLQNLIQAIGGLLAASSELLGRLQLILSRGEPAGDDPDVPPPPDGPAGTDRSEG